MNPLADTRHPPGRLDALARRTLPFNPVWVLNAAIVAAALWLFFAAVHDDPPLAGPRIHWWWLAAAFVVAERAVVHLHFRRNAHSFSLGDLPLVFGLIFATPHDLILGASVGTAAVLLVDRKLPPIKFVFNVAQFALAASMAVTVLHLLLPAGHGIGPAAWVAAFVAMQVSAAVTVLLIGAAIALSEGGLRLATLGQMFSMDLVVTVTNTSLGLCGAVILAIDARAMPLLAVPALTLFLAYRAYLAERQRHERLEFLYEANRTLSRAPEIVLALEGLLARSLDAFRAELAEIILFGSEESPPLRTTLGPGDYKELMQPVDPAIGESVRGLLEASGAGATLCPPYDNDAARRYLDGRGVSHAMLAVLPGEERVIGTIMLANRSGVVRTFSSDDLKLFETLAANASVALQYDRLEQAVTQLRELQEQLEHQVFHDPLTDLANRTLFLRSLDAALERTADELGVLFIDLDDFKTVNDSLGHGVGDELLVAVAERLRESLRPSDLVARLGGDEFAVMVEDRADAANAASMVAERIMEAFKSPVSAGNELISVHLSIGIATSRYARRGDELIRNADVAMYQAKDAGKGGCELFQPRMGDAVLRRHDLKAELRNAVDRGELLVYYQPIVGLESGQVVAAEALVRWQHPGRGIVLPSEFVPLAEETGLIVELGRYVLEDACQQARRWFERWSAPDDGPPIDIHVNLSAVELQNPGLIEGVAAALDSAGLDPGWLVLEITESLLVGDAESTGETLHSLRDVGVRLALDDFGTGYSSLSYLNTLPLDMLKIAKPFVDGLSRGGHEGSFVRMMIELAKTLDLAVVAEGIETAEQLEALRVLGCGLGQGFFLGEPLHVRNDRALEVRAAAA